jgi:hypothetical protein
MKVIQPELYSKLEYGCCDIKVAKHAFLPNEYWWQGKDVVHQEYLQGKHVNRPPGILFEDAAIRISASYIIPQQPVY